jgi:hypothetical protein
MEDFNFSSFVYSSFTWRDEATLELTVRYVETPFYHTFVCRFQGDDIRIERFINVSFGPTELAPIRGKLVDNND